MKEIWKPSLTHPGRYEVSNLGRVRTVPRILKPGFTVHGYPQVCQWEDGVCSNRAVHRLVLEAFVGPRPEGFVCAHLDGNPKNNNIDNLAWVTQKENVHHMVAHGTANRGERNGQAALTAGKVRMIRGMRVSGQFDCQTVADIFGTTQGNISTICIGKTWKHL